MEWLQVAGSKFFGLKILFLFARSPGVVFLNDMSINGIVHLDDMGYIPEN